MKWNDIYKISRPRFWIYYAGTYAVGASLGAASMQDFTIGFFLLLAFFTFPANFFIYGINDYFDWETDKLNPKKRSKEYLLKPENKKKLRYLLVIPVLLGLLLTLLIQPSLLWFMIAFLAIGGWYSAPPFRFKARAFFDSFSNLFYVIPGFMSYYQFTGSLPPVEIMIAAMIWSMSMHLYSAVPDITPDSKAKITTTATVLGKKWSLLLCTALWLTSSILTVPFAPLIALLGLVYPLVALGSFKNIEKIYWFYPYINAIMGGVIFWFGAVSWSGLF